METSSKGVAVIQAIDRAAKVLSSLQGARHLGITELAAALELPPSTVHGIVKSLQQHGLVAKERGSNRYMLGPALLKLSLTSHVLFILLPHDYPAQNENESDKS